jgi:hypothetical protein
MLVRSLKVGTTSASSSISAASMARQRYLDAATRFPPTADGVDASFSATARRTNCPNETLAFLALLAARFRSAGDILTAT